MELRYTGDRRPSRNTLQTCIGRGCTWPFQRNCYNRWRWALCSFMISDFFCVLNVVFFHSGDSLVSKIYVLICWNTVSSIFMEDWNDKYEVCLTCLKVMKLFKRIWML
jgi:hypothetical protein